MTREKGENLTREQIEALRQNIELRQRRMDKTLEKIEELDAAIQAVQRSEEERKQNRKQS
jgi:hypothetical protein